MARKALTSNDVELTLACIPNDRWALRNRLLVQMTHLAGARVVDLANMTIGDVLTLSGEVMEQVELANSRRLVLCGELRHAIAEYLVAQFGLKCTSGAAYTFGSYPLFYTQKLNAFTPAVLSHLFTRLYRNAGLTATGISGRKSWLRRIAKQVREVKHLEHLAGKRALQRELQLAL